MEHRLEPVEILDWYDGIVLGVVRASWDRGLFLASLLSWSQENGIRVLALLRIEEAEAVKIKSIARGPWGELLLYLRALCDRSTDDLIVLRIDQRNDEILSVTT